MCISQSRGSFGLRLFGATIAVARISLCSHVLQCLLFVFCFFLGTSLSYASDPHATSSKKSEKSHGDVKEEPVLRQGVGEEAFDSASKEHKSIDVALVLDSSGSMKRTDPNRLRDQGAKLLLRLLAPDDRLALLRFDTNTEILSGLTYVDPKEFMKFDQLIDQIPNDGGFTDLGGAVEAAQKLLKENGRPESRHVIILLSDGKMDPLPSVGSPEERSKWLISEVIPRVVDAGDSIYTLAFSEEADKKLLGKIARRGNGLQWYAQDANLVHEKFTELFMSLKQPQTLSLIDESFEVDQSISEATFYITRKDPDIEISLLDPLGTEIQTETGSSSLRWYKGKFFDVITIDHPLPGTWRVRGLNGSDGLATLVTDVEMQVSWPKDSVTVGEKLSVVARVLQGGKPVMDRGLRDLMFFTYKIVDTNTGEVIDRGKLTDEGKDGDDKAGDGIYSSVVQPKRTGEFKALLSVTSPTFSRQQQIPFQVFDGSVSLSLIPKQGGGDLLKLVLGKNVQKWKKIEKTILAKSLTTDKVTTLSVEPNPKEPGTFVADPSLLKNGSYLLSGRAKGVNTKGKVVEEKSKTVEYEVVNSSKVSESKEEEEQPTQEVAEEEAPSTGGETDWTLMMAIAVSVLWLIGSGYVSVRSLKIKDLAGSLRKEWIVPEDTMKRFLALRVAASGRRKKCIEGDSQLFSKISDVFLDPDYMEVVGRRVLSMTGGQQANKEPESSGDGAQDGGESEEAAAA